MYFRHIGRLIYLRKTSWYLNNQVRPKETAAVFEAILQVDQVSALLQLVSNHKNLIPCLTFAAPQDLVVDQERKELVLDDVPLPHSKEDLLNGKEKHRCSDQNVWQVKDNSVDLEKKVFTFNPKENLTNLVHKAIVVDPPSVLS